MGNPSQKDFNQIVRNYCYLETEAPGPGNYKNVHSMPKTGNYILSQNKGGTMAKFDGLKR